MPILGEPAVTSAQFAPLRFSQAARSSRAAFDLTGMQQGFCGSATAFRFDFVPAVSPSALHFSRSPTAD
jgi:hypothetical protein